MNFRALLLLAGSFVAALGLSGCGTIRFYRQAMDGQAEILRKARPVSQVVEDRQTGPELKRKLALAQEVVRFAREQLDLPTEGRYDRYKDLHRKYVTWVVYAAPEFSLEGKKWWYPVVGSLKYRGFFSEAAAKEEAVALKARGYDVFAGGVEAYSTLGWFHDPILNTFLNTNDAQFAELLFHELTHVKLFIPGDTDFNEAFATANSEAAVRRWLAAKGDRKALENYDAELEKDRQVIRLLLDTREKLKRLYEGPAIGAAAMRSRKTAIFDELRVDYVRLSRQWGGRSRYDRTFAMPWNNARLNTVATYYDLVPGFERLLKANGGDPKRFYAAVQALGKLSQKERRAALMTDKP